MKQTTPITREEEVFTCDYCGKQMPFPTKTCFGCGKHTCNDSCNWKMTEYPAGRPATLDVSQYRHGTGVYLPCICFCEKCDQTNKLAKLLQAIRTLDADIVEKFAEYRRQHYKLAGAADRIIEKSKAP